MLKRVIAAGLSAVAVIALNCSAVHAGELGSPTPVSERLKGADTVVVATARFVEPTWAAGPSGDQIIVTRVLLEITETLKGINQPTRWLDVPGGTLGDITLSVPDQVVIAEGDRGVFFLDVPRSGFHSPHGKAEAFLPLGDHDVVTGTTITLDDIRRLAAERR